MTEDQDLKKLLYRAENGVVEAQKNLALLNELGLDGQPNEEEALKNWLLAAEAGDGFACLQAAQALEKSGDAEKIKQAKSLYRQAKKLGYVPSRSKTEVLKVESYFDGTVLIADDNSVDRLALKHLIAKRGLAVETAENGLEAAKLLASHPKKYAMLMVDINMPSMNGLQLIQRIRKVKALQKLPIIVVSSETNSQSIKTARQLGITGWLVKPASSERILHMLSIAASG